MLIYDRIKLLCKEKGVTITGTEAELGFARGSLCKIDKNKPSMEKVNRLAFYLGVSPSFLMTGKEEPDKNEMLSAEDARDIALDFENAIKKLDSGESVSVVFEGIKITPTMRKFIMEQLSTIGKYIKESSKDK